MCLHVVYVILEQAQKCGGVKPVIGITIFISNNWISNDNTVKNEQYKKNLHKFASSQKVSFRVIVT